MIEETFSRENEIGIPIEYTVIGNYIDKENKEYKIYTNFAPSNDIYGLRINVDEKTENGYTPLERDKEKDIIEQFHKEIERRVKAEQNNSERERLIKELEDSYKDGDIEKEEQTKKELLSVLQEEIVTLQSDVEDLKKINPEHFEELTEEISPKEIDKLENLKNQLEEAIKKGNAKEITAWRGRVIRELQTELKNASENEKEGIKQELEEALDKHKEQIDDRYQKEYNKQKKTFKAILTVLPKGVALAFKKVAATIEELKLAVTNKEKVFKAIETAKDTLKALGTPIDFTVRFAINHWYLLLLLLRFKLPKIKLPGHENTQDDKQNQTNLEEERVPEEVTQDQLERVENLNEAPEPIKEALKGHTTEDIREEMKELRKIRAQKPSPIESTIADGQEELSGHSTLEMSEEMKDIRKIGEEGISPVESTVVEEGISPVESTVVEEQETLKGHTTEDIREEMKELRKIRAQEPSPIDRKSVV